MAYSVQETNGLINGLEYHNNRNEVGIVDWTTPGLTITRLRLISDPGYPEWDVSYCHGKLNGEDVRVNLPFSSLPKGRYKSVLYEEAKKTGCFIKGLFSAISTLN